MDLKDFIKVTKIFTKDECNDALQNHLAKTWEPHRWYDPVKKEEFTKDIDPYNNIFDSEFSNVLCERVMHSTVDYMRNLSQVGVVNFLSMPRLNRYQVGQEMTLHPDHIQSLFDGERKGIPVMSYIVLLNDEFEGGNFEYKFADGSTHKVDLTAGDLVMWPSLFLYPHRITPVTKGERISVVVWGW